MGSRASRDTCEGDIRLRVTHLLSPICSRSPRTEIRELFRTVSTSSLMFDMTVIRTSGVIAMPPEVPVRKILPLTTVVSIIDAISTVTPFVVPPAPEIERLVMQAEYFSNCRLTKSREFLSLFRLSSSSPAPTLPRIRRLSFRSTVFRLYEGTNRLRLERPCCSR